MSNPDSYIREINSLDDEIKRLNSKLKALREQKRSKQDLLYKYMTKNHIDKYGGITAKSIRPRENFPRKPESEKKSDAITLFTQLGIENPEEVYKEFKLTQKYQKQEDSESSSQNVHKKSETKTTQSNVQYDPFLGF